MTYFYLALAIAAEVAGTTLLKATEEFTKLVPTTFLVIFYLMSFWLMTLALRELPLGVVYAVWSGLGIVLVACSGAIIYKEMPDLRLNNWYGVNYFRCGSDASILNIYSNINYYDYRIKKISISDALSEGGIGHQLV